MAALPQEVVQFIKERTFAAVATLMPDGSPQATVVWVDTNGEHVLVNTTRDRQKPRNVQRDPRVAITIFDPGNPYRQVAIRGRVVEVTDEGAEEHIDQMARKYQGKATYQRRSPNERRLLVKIVPNRVHRMMV